MFILSPIPKIVPWRYRPFFWLSSDKKKDTEATSTNIRDYFHSQDPKPGFWKSTRPIDAILAGIAAVSGIGLITSFLKENKLWSCVTGALTGIAAIALGWFKYFASDYSKTSEEIKAKNEEIIAEREEEAKGVQEAENKTESEKRVESEKKATEQEHSIWRNLEWEYNEKEGTYLWDANNITNLDIDEPDKGKDLPIMQRHKIFSEKFLGGGSLVIAFDPKGRITVYLNRLTHINLNSIPDKRRGNLFICSISSNQKLTQAQKDLIKAFLGDSHENLCWKDYCGISPAITRSEDKKRVVLSKGSKHFYATLKKWAEQARLSKPKEELVQEFLSNNNGTKCFTYSPENCSALLKTVFDLDERGELKGQAGDVIAVVGEDIHSGVSQFKPRWVLNGGEKEN